MKYFKCESDIHIKNIYQGDSNKKGLFLTLIATLLTVLPAFASAQELITQYSVGDKPVDLAIGQLNNDNYPDIVVANKEEKSISVFLSDGFGGYLDRVDYLVGDFATGIILADIDSDGHADILVTNIGDIIGNSDAGLFLGDGSGNFNLRDDYEGYSDEEADMEVADFNNDSLPDIVSVIGVIDGDPGYVTVSLNDIAVSGVFQQQPSVEVGSGAIDVDVADVNEDGKLDVVTANKEGSNVSVLLGDGTGGFFDRKDFAVEEEPGSVAIGDVNNDDNLDLVSASIGFHAISVLLGDGNGGFSTSKEYQVGNGPESVVIADVNNDDNADIVTANYISFLNNPALAVPDSVTVLPGNGSGEFNTRLDFSVGDGPFFAVVADVNLDSQAEIISADKKGDTITILTPLMPAAEGKFLELEESQVVHGVLQADDLQGDSLTFDIATQAQHGEVTITNAATGDFEYAPTTGYVGTDSFTFIASDGEYNSAPGTINIIVKPSGQGDNDGSDTDNDDTASGDGGGSMGWIFIGLLLGAGFWRGFLAQISGPDFWLRAIKSGGNK